MVEIQRILVAIDGSDNARRAALAAAGLAYKLDATLVLAHVMTKVGMGRIPQELQAYAEIEHVRLTDSDVLAHAAEGLLQATAKELREAYPVSITTTILDGEAAGAIVDCATHNKTDLIVMGRRGLGNLAGLLLGSVSHKVAQLCPCPCLTVP